MSIFKQRLSKQTKIQIATISAAIILILILLILDFIFKGPLTHLLTNKNEVVTTVKAWGIFGPLLFISLQIIQTVIAPIPGNISGTVGGFLFGWWGVLWTAVGTLFGFWIVFLLSRRFGRTLIEKIIKKESLNKFDHLAEAKGSTIFFLIFLIPGLPDDIVGYIAGLTKIPIRILLALVIIGRLPAIIATNMFGAGLGEDNIIPVVVIAVISAIVCVAVAIKHDSVMSYLESTHHKDQE